MDAHRNGASVVVTLGRGAGETNQAMDPFRWGRFQADVIAALDRHNGVYFRSIPSVGQHNGSAEEHVLIFGLLPYGAEENFRDWLAKLASDYDQQGVPVIIGQAYYIEPDGTDGAVR